MANRISGYLKGRISGQIWSWVFLNRGQKHTTKGKHKYADVYYGEQNFIHAIFAILLKNRKAERIHKYFFGKCKKLRSEIVGKYM